MYKHIVIETEPFHIGTQGSRLLCDEYTESYRPKKYKHAATQTEVYTRLTSCGTIRLFNLTCCISMAIQ